MLKAANVRLLGFETTGNEQLQVRIEGDTASVAAALSTAESRAEQLGSKAVVCVLAHPAPQLASAIHSPNSQNALYGGRDQFLASDFPQPKGKSMNGTEQALGILETQGL